MPSEFALKSMNQIHRVLLKVSAGRIGWSAGKMPVVELMTTGRRSGQQRSSMLTSPWQDGETMALVASAGGNDQDPAWFLNLRDNPSVKIKTKDGTRGMTARIATGDERSDLWNQITSKYKNYARYQTKTEREIPVVLLEPVD